jgi:phage terminase large subunit-like protein
MGEEAARVSVIASERERLTRLVAELEARPLAHPLDGRAYLSDHDPWYVEVTDPLSGVLGCAGQRAFLRSTSAIRAIVAGRQSGKTHQAAEEVIRIILARPGSESCLLMPTYKSTKGAIRHLRRALEPLGSRVQWKEQDKCFVFPNGATLYLRTADDKTGVPTRGLTLDGVLWVDEAVFVPKSAWEAAQFTQGAVRDPVTIITTTPFGRTNWVFELCAGASDDPDTEWFRFRTTDSPYHNPRKVEQLRKRVGAKRAQEELDAVFIGETDMPFPPDLIDRAFSKTGLPIRGQRLTLGVDLGKKNDFTTIVLTNEFNEAWALDRFRENREQPDARFYVQVRRRIVERAREHKALVVVDESGGAGHVMADQLTEDLGADRVLRVQTGNHKTKAELIEAVISDLEHGRMQIDGSTDLGAELRHEMTFFPPPVRDVRAGVEVVKYEGPPDDDDEDGEGLHDDCLMALVMARFGAVHGWEKIGDPCAGDWSGFSGAIDGDIGPVDTAGLGDWSPLA